MVPDQIRAGFRSEYRLHECMDLGSFITMNELNASIFVSEFELSDTFLRLSWLVIYVSITQLMNLYLQQLWSW